MRFKSFASALSVVCTLLVVSVSAQNNVGVGTTTPDLSAIMDISATDRGVLVPRTDTLSITAPATGLLIYTPTDSAFWYFDGIYWRSAFGPQSNLPLLLPNGTFGQTLYYDTITNVGWTATSFLWNSSNQIGVNTSNPDGSAIMEIVSRTQGFLPPRMTEAERDAIANPAQGLVVFNLSDSTLDIFNGNCWLASYQQNCTDCILTATPNSTAGTIDRVVADSIQFQIAINQINGTPQNIALQLMSALPAGVTANFSANPTFSTSTVNVSFHASPFAPAGTFPIVIQVLCGGSTINIIYSLTILPCYVVDVINSVDNYNLGVDLYVQHPTAPTNQPVCVVNNIATGVTITSPSSTVPAYTTGTLPAGSVVAIVNDGNIIGRGGDGGVAYDPANGLTGDGVAGGDAVIATLDATILNNAVIFGGGGGGGAMAFSLAYTTPSIPLIGPLTIGFFVGSGGGGGAGLGVGGDYNTNLFIGYAVYDEGTDGTGGVGGVQGQGGLLNAPFSFAAGPATITITPNTNGGDGGPYGFSGTQGSFALSLTVTVTVPFIGNIPIGPINIPIPVPPPLAGVGGYAIRHNGNTINIPDNLYNTSQLKGEVGP
jgi:hypothetical protein